MPRDVAIVLAEGTPGPIKKFLADQLNTLGLNVDHSVTASIITVHVPDPMLESHAAHSLGDIELRLREGATLKMSEQDHPMRAHFLPSLIAPISHRAQEAASFQWRSARSLGSTTLTSTSGVTISSGLQP